jgi:DNA polymerase-3 subunit epsilon
MNLKLFYDTETTGLPDFKAPSESAHQPHIVQLAALLVDMDTRETIQSMDVIIRPDGWTIPDDVAAIHGITTQHALDVGIPESLAVSMFMELWAGRPRVAHNQQFDARIVRIALMRYQSEESADIWKSGHAECTAVLASPICNLPPSEAQQKNTNFKRKTPNLGEAFAHFTGNDLVNAHSAMADVMACRDVYFAIKGAQQ